MIPREGDSHTSERALDTTLPPQIGSTAHTHASFESASNLALVFSLVAVTSRSSSLCDSQVTLDSFTEHLHIPSLLIRPQLDP